jgi:putative CGCGG family rSAM target protein
MEKDWTKDLEHDEYEFDIELILKDALEAVEITKQGHFVNLVTSSHFGNPVEYLQPLLEQVFHKSIIVKYIDQCGCGGHVLRVWKTDS